MFRPVCVSFRRIDCSLLFFLLGGENNTNEMGGGGDGRARGPSAGPLLRLLALGVNELKEKSEQGVETQEYSGGDANFYILAEGCT